MRRETNEKPQERVLSVVRSYQPIILGEILKKLGISQFSGSNLILSMIRNGDLRYEENGKAIVAAK